MNNSLEAAVNELVKWEQLMKEGRAEISKLKLIIQKEAETAFESIKTKQLKYWGDDNNCAVATRTEKVELISYAFLVDIIPEVILKEFVKAETTHKMTDAFKKILQPLLTGDYIEKSIYDVIKEMGLDEATQKVARKKLKGKFEKDSEWLQEIGRKQEEAEHWAYFVAEAAAWEKILKLMKVSGYEEGTEKFEKALNDLKHAMISEPSIKIGIDYEED